MTKRGGVRPGAGRPLKSPEEIRYRPQRGVRAYDDEWELISHFAKLVKYGRQAECERFLKQMGEESPK